VPLERVDVHADIQGAQARVTCTQRYRNNEPRPIEAVYVFPLDEGAAVCGFAAVVGGTRYVGTVKPREQAFAEYDDAIAAGHGAFLLDEERPDVFTASVGNLAPGTEVEIEVTYVAELPFEGESIRFMLPTTVSPRYAPPEDRIGVGRSPEAALNPPRAREVPYGLTLTATVSASSRIRRIESPSHPIAVDTDGDRAVVTLSQERVALDRDLVLLITPSEPAAPHVVLERTEAGPLAAAVTFRPTFSVAHQPVDVVFLVDRSGSMQGSSIEQVRNALQLCLRSLQSGSGFNIVGFGSAFESLFEECRPYDERTLAEASRYVDALDANLGGTDILPALEFVLTQAPRTRVLQLVVLTDGQVTNTDAVLDAVRRHADRVRVFTFGIGRGISYHLVRGLARVGSGAAEFVYPGERLEGKVVRLFRRAMSPTLRDVHIDWSDARVVTIPATVGPLFGDEPLRAYAWIKSAATTVSLRALGPNGPLSWQMDLQQIDIADGTTVGTLAARARIRELEEGGEWSPERGSRQRERKSDRAVAEIVRLATEYGLASRETSWVAVEEREVPVTAEAALRRIPIAITSGWGGRDHEALSLNSLSLDQTGSIDPSTLIGFDAFAPSEGPIVTGFRSIPPPQASRWTAARPFARLGRSRVKEDANAVRDSTRVLDRLVALQRADGSWDLDEAFAQVVGIALSDLAARIAGVRGDAGEASRAWATALALAFLEREAVSNRDEWELLATKARRWLSGVTVTPPEGGEWSDLAATELS
jgi:Ca-activated chloride channel family protein